MNTVRMTVKKMKTAANRRVLSFIFLYLSLFILLNSRQFGRYVRICIEQPDLASHFDSP